jgi:hypothetical protein
MSTKCQTCGGRATLFLCGNHVAELRETLDNMPTWIDYLADAVHGLTRLGDSGRRSRADEAPLRVNLRASDLLAKVTNSLTTWMRHTLENRGIVLVPMFFIGPLRTNEERASINGLGATALWLATNVNALASDETAGEMLAELRGYVIDIERVINPPEEPRECGPCPSTADGHRCNFKLTVPKRDTWVTCPSCKVAHHVETLIDKLIAETDYMQCTIVELCDTVLPRLNEHVPRATLHHWHAKGWLQPKGYRRVRGKSIPLFVLIDVRRLRSERLAAKSKVDA